MDTVRTQLQDQINTAIAEKSTLHICGGNSKKFYGNAIHADQDIDIKPYQGIISYEPSELCITVRAGTLLSDLEKELTKNQQMLPFEPPYFTDKATIGGTVSAGLSGPARPYTGAVRDAILGMTIINGSGEIISFGGQVMKNVAGYDVSRLMTGAQGTLGLILEVSLRLIPKPEASMTYQLPLAQQEAIDHFAEIRRSRLPVTASCYFDNHAYIRLSSTKAHLETLTSNNPFQPIENNHTFWQSVRNQSHDFFQQHEKPLWRISMPPAAAASQELKNQLMIEWGGGIRWISTNTPANVIKGIAKKTRGNAILFKGNISGVNTFPKPEPALFTLQQQLKRRLDPVGIFNPDRLFEGL